MKSTFAVYSPKAEVYAYLDMGRVSFGPLPRKSSVSDSLSEARAMRDGYNARLLKATLSNKRKAEWQHDMAKENLKELGELVVVKVSMKVMK